MLQIRDIRKQAVSDLKAAAIVGILDNVFPSRSRKIWPAEGDTLLVYTQNSDADDQDTAPVIYQVDTTLVVRIVVQETDDADLDNDAQEEALESRLDEITEAVVRALQPVHGIAGPLAGLADWVHWKGLRPYMTAEGDVPRNSRQVLFSVIWSAELPDTLPTAEFLRAGTELSPPDVSHAEGLASEFITEMRTT